MVYESSITALSERFQALWRRCLLPDMNMDNAPVFEDLLKRYSEPGRSYHKWTHLTHCLQEFDRAATLMESPDAVELALWFHDAVYVPGAVDNEQRSADLFSHWGATGFPGEFVGKIRDLILVTMHVQPSLGGDESYIADIDLSSFGTNWPDFLQDSLNIRQEQAQIPDAQYYPAHAKFLKMLLNRPRIFHTDFFYNFYEATARQNIKRLLATTLYEANAAMLLTF